MSASRQEAARYAAAVAGRRGSGRHDGSIVTGLERPSIDPVLCRTVARALAWMDQVRAGTSIAAIAQTDGVSERFIRARLPLALLSPHIVAAGPAAGLAEH